MPLPTIIQGGMGVAISNWRLARTVSELGHLGVVSGTGISRVMICRLGDGDLDGQVRYALSHFPDQAAVTEILDRYFVHGGKRPDQPYKNSPVYTVTPTKRLDMLTVIANFVEVFLAKDGHHGLVGVNLLEKVQLPNLASLYGAMLAGVDVVLMGAGIPIQIPLVLDKLVKHEPVSYRLDVQGADPDDDIRIHFDPERIFPGLALEVGLLKRPQFLPIISSFVLAQALLKRSEGTIEGFVIEGAIAGGHNAPPRGPLVLNELGEPVYGEKDVVDLEKMKQLGLPFWLAGGYGNHDQLQKALDAGAAGIQVGTAFAFCEESGMAPMLKHSVLSRILNADGADPVRVFTSPVASPTGFPFKVVLQQGTLSELSVYEQRSRICDLSFLRTIYKRPDGEIGYRCPAEPIKDYVRKGGTVEDTVGTTCLCNNLAATAGFGQSRILDNGSMYVEPPIITSGDDLPKVGQHVRVGKTSYTAQDVIECLQNSKLEEVSGTVNTQLPEPG